MRLINLNNLFNRRYYLRGRLVCKISVLCCLALFSCREYGDSHLSDNPLKNETRHKRKGRELPLFTALRNNMVEEQIIRRKVKDAKVLEAMRTVRRHMFVPEELRKLAYNDTPLPIGENQTISQPYIVAYMTEIIQPDAGDVVLDVGTGSGYQAAVLAKIVSKVYSMEIICGLAERASGILGELGYTNVEVKCGDGYQGWPEHAPFDAIIVAAAPERVPVALKQQLKIGGRMVLPVGRPGWHQELLVVTRTNKDSWREERLLAVRFVPMTGGEETHN